VNGSSHVVFGLAGAVVVDSFLHLSGPSIVETVAAGHQVTGALAIQKVIYYGFAAIGSLAPDIDNARSTIGKRAGIISKGIQHFAGHRRFFHSILGLIFVGVFIYAVQYVAGLLLYRTGADAGARQIGEALGGSALGLSIAMGAGIAFSAFLVGYFLHLVADSLTEGGVPWLWPSHLRLGFPPNRKWRFKSGSAAEPVVVVGVCIVVILAVVTQHLVV
jgi:inner membrane protein